MTAVKFCGITNPQEAGLAATAGADAIGVILAPSPRQVDLRVARLIARSERRPRQLIAVLGEELSEIPRLCDLGFQIQVCNEVDHAKVIRLTQGRPYLRVVHVMAAGRGPIRRKFASEETPLFDTAAADRYGGTGRSFRWDRIAQIASRRPIIVAGGLTAANVEQCILTVRPFAVDVRTGIEVGGQKPIEKMRDFVKAVRNADAVVYAR